MLVGKLQNPLK